MRALFGALLLVVTLSATGGCDLRSLILESDLAPQARDELVEACCACLANGQTFLRGDACSGEELPPLYPEDAGDADAGPATRNPCLCGTDAETCSTVLIGGGVLDVVGACTAVGGMCQPQCEGVLAYP